MWSWANCAKGICSLPVGTPSRSHPPHLAHSHRNDTEPSCMLMYTWGFLSYATIEGVLHPQKSIHPLVTPTNPPQCSAITDTPVEVPRCLTDLYQSLMLRVSNLSIL